MLIENQISHFVKKCYKDKILKQIPEIYDSHQALLTLTLNIDLTKVFTSDKEIGIFIIGNYPLFNDKVEESILEIML